MVKYRPRLTKTDKLCLIALVGCFLAPHLMMWAMDETAYRAAEEDKPPASVAERLPLQIDPTVFYGETPNAVFLPPAVDDADLIAEELAQEDPYDETIPLDRELQAVLWEACEENGVAVCDALGVIWTESRFDPEADSGISYGLMGLNKKYYPSDLTPAEQIRAGVKHLAGQIERYDGDIQAALRAYNKGWDDGDRVYARIVLYASEKWGNG